MTINPLRFAALAVALLASGTALSLGTQLRGLGSDGELAIWA